MRPLTDVLPKTLLPVAGRAFAWHQMHWLAAQGIDDVVYCIAHQGEQIRQYWATQPAPVRSLRYVDEGAELRGTGGALRLALDERVLDESFFVLYGDSFLPVGFAPVWSAFEASGSPALMTVLKNQGRWDRSNVIYDGGRVRLYTVPSSAQTADKAVSSSWSTPSASLISFARPICSRRKADSTASRAPKFATEPFSA